MFNKLMCFCVTASCFLPVVSASAQTVAPTGENFAACVPVEDCVTNGIPQVVDGCYSANPACVSTNHDKTVVTAEEVADRAIAKRSCATKVFTSKSACDRCYLLAELPVEFRYDGDLFHGLMGYSKKLIANAMHQKCDGIAGR